MSELTREHLRLPRNAVAIMRELVALDKKVVNRAGEARGPTRNG